MARFRVRATPHAEDELRRIVRWWRANRPKNPDLLRGELVAARALLATQPEVGVHAEDVGRGVQRLLLQRTQYFIYYRINRAANLVQILAVWHTSRERPPRV